MLEYVVPLNNTLQINRTFVIFLKQAKPDSDLKLNNLTGAGRLDVLCRVMTSCFFLSNNFRTNTELYAYFQTDALLIHFDGRYLRGLNPDERSIAGYLRRVFQQRKIKGVSSRLLALEDVPQLFPKGYLLDLEASHKNFNLQQELTKQIFFLGDHLGFTQEEKQLLRYLSPLSIGKTSLLTSQCISILHHWLDSK